jgi:hypothetical protein
VSATGLLLSRRKAAYWSERWINRPDLLTRLVGALRAAGVGPSIEVDDGWQPARDVSVSAGRWAWLDLRTLVEDHGSGKVLVRLASRVRLTPIGLAAAAFWLLVLVGSANGSKFMAGLIPVLSVLIALWLLRRLGRTEAAIRECVERTVLELGATPLLEKPASRRRRIDQPSHPASSHSLIPSPLTGPLNVVVLDEPVMLAHPRASAPMARLSHENEPNPPPVNPRPGMVA